MAIRVAWDRTPVSVHGKDELEFDSPLTRKPRIP